MVSPTKRVSFLETEEGKEIWETLQSMAANNFYNTVASYTPDSLTYPNNLIPFVDRHINYLNTHPNLEARKYIANIKLMTRIKQ